MRTTPAAHVLWSVTGTAVVTGAIWLIREEGQRFRESTSTSIERGLEAAADRVVDRAADKAQTVVGEVAERAGDLVRDAAEVPGRVVQDVLEKLPEPADTAAPSQSAQESPAAEEEPREKLPAPGGATTAQPSSIDPASVVGELFRIGRSVAREVDKAGQEVFRISEAEERRFGERFHAALRTEFDIEANGPTSRRLVRLATPILSRRSRSGPTYRFFVVGDPRPNAFAHAGGYVYVTRGLLELGVSDDELQFALAHEIAHVELGHVLATLAYWVQARKVAGEPAGEVAAMLHSLIATGYSQDKEFAADAWALRAMLASGKSRAGAIGLLQRLQREEGPEKENRGPGTKPASAAEAVARELGDHFRSHPPTRDRIERLEEIDE